uniref:Putative secreted protein n=1 Tax=Amblyomma triste TaxID=251400 RepID=A0A023G5L0_AMBTT
MTKKLTFCFFIFCAWWTCFEAKLLFIPAHNISEADRHPKRANPDAEKEMIRKLLSDAEHPVVALWGNREKVMKGVTACWMSSYVSTVGEQLHHNLTFRDREKTRKNREVPNTWATNQLHVTYTLGNSVIQVETSAPGEVMDDGQRVVSKAINGTWQVLGVESDCFLVKLPPKGTGPCLVWARVESFDVASIPCLSRFYSNGKECPDNSKNIYNIASPPNLITCAK